MADDKIKNLRDWMASHKLDAYLVPHSDRFQSEYLQSGDERLAWLTGFTGSAGMAAITADKAVLYTDGRYILQAEKQVDGDVFDIVEAPPANPLVWLSDNLPDDAVIGFDPWLFTVAQIKQWERSTNAQGWEFNGVEGNPIDLQWHDKAAEPIVMASPHPMKFAGQSTADKIAAVLKKKNAAAGYLLISEPALVCWLLNMRGRDVAHTPVVQSVALLDEHGQVVLFTDPQKITDDLRKIWGETVVVEDLENLPDHLATIDGKLQIDPSLCAFAVKEFCLEQGIDVVEAADPAILLRACKNKTEIDGAFDAHDKDAVAFAEFKAWFAAQDFVRDTITELDIVSQLAQCRRAVGAVDDSFDTIAGFGPNGAIVHYRADETSNLRLVPGNLLLLDSGGQYYEGTTDVTRVLAIGTPNAAMKTHYTAVLKGLIALSTTRFPVGTSGGALDALARAPIWALGLDYAHGTGHGVGSFLSVHEGPVRFRAGSDVPLQAGMILSIEPGIYLASQYGIRLENLVVVVQDKRADDVKDMLAFKTLTKLPFEANLIEWTQLSACEIQWLKDFQTFQA